MNFTFRPIANDWQGERTLPANRKHSPFQATYTKTLELLEYELDKLDAETVVFQLDLEEAQIRRDGMLRAHVSPDTPALILSFDSRHGPLRYATDVFPSWHDNLRAIALGLEALRKVDRYGISKRGEQYTGWLQIEAPGVALGEAQRVLIKWAGVPPERAEAALREPSRLYRLAARKAHPDTGGTEEAFNEVQEAWRVLGGGS